MIVKDGDFENAIMTQVHSHSASKVLLCKTKTDKKINKICDDNKFITARLAYNKARERTAPDDIPYMPDKTQYHSFVHRKKRKYEPNIPYSFEEFEKFINDEKYKERYVRLF